MQIQVNSDKTITVDAKLTAFVEGEVGRALDRFSAKLTRVEVHLSDIDNKRTGRADKRCLIEVRPAGDAPASASAIASTTDSAVREAAAKVKRLLTTFFGRRGRTAEEVAAPVAKPMKAPAKKSAVKKPAKKKTATKKASMKKPTKLSTRGPKKKGIYQARRESSSSRQRRKG